MLQVIESERIEEFEKVNCIIDARDYCLFESPDYLFIATFNLPNQLIQISK